MSRLPDPLEGELVREEEPIASGGFGDVYRGTWTPPSADPVPVAIKRVRMARMNLEAEDEVDPYGRFETVCQLRSE